MSAGDMLTKELRQAISERKVVVVAGSGVSCATTKQAPSWKRLIESGAERCQALRPSVSWFNRIQAMLNPDAEDDMSPEDRVESLITAAEWVEKKLKSFGDGEFASWLRRHFENLPCDEPSVIDAIVQLNLPIITTNYDELISKRSGLKYATWHDKRKVGTIVRDDDRRVLHLHGHWDHPETVVLGIRSYEAIKNSEHTQTVMRSLGTSKSLLFIGCGNDGLNDPNFGNFLSWLAEWEKEAKAEHRHFRLVRHSDKEDPIGRLVCVGYGDEYKNLAGFLNQLRPTPEAPEQDTSIDPVVSRIRTEVPESISHYLSRLADDTSRLQLLRMGSEIQLELPISEAYVPLRTCPTRHMETMEAGRFSPENVADDVDVELANVFQRANEYKLRGVVLLGEPGAGKTTGARQLAWQLSSGQRLPKDLGLPVGTTPVLLRLKNLNSQALSNDNGLRVFLQQEKTCTAAPDGLNAPGAELWNGRGGPLLWILDGLDEVANPQDRQKVSGWVQEAIQDRPFDYFLVTCRFAGYFKPGVPLVAGFAEFHVRPLDEIQIRRFVRDWYKTAYRRMGNSVDPENTSDSLLKMLERPAYQTQRIRELCGNPLMLTILCIVYHTNKKLPENRFELYEKCVNVLLEHWRHGASAFDSTSAQSVLTHVAWWMHSEPNRTAAPLNQLSKQAASALKRLKEDAGLGQDGLAFLNRMKDETGILASEQNGRLGFLHLSFQEFLAANHAASYGKSKLVAQQAADSWWQEVALLSLRHSERYSQSFFRELLQSGVAERNPSVAESCISETRWLPLKQFKEVLKKGDAPGQIIAVLRLLRSRTSDMPGLAELVLPLAKSPNESVSLLAGEILAQLGVVVEAPKMHGNVMHHSPGNITLIRIRPGEFQMGSNKRDSDERPIHPVRITKEFLLGRYAVTNAQYAEYLKAVKRKRKPEYWDDRRFNQPEQPVVGVSWDDAQKFCKWAGCRLPTEAEWEFACRSGTTTAFSFSEDEGQLDKYGWYVKNSGGQTQPVGTKEPNAWGLHDMHGNVWEWCQDWYGPYGKTSQVDPVGPESGQGRVLRGGSWNDPADICRSSFRFNVQPDVRSIVIGFRVARTL